MKILKIVISGFRLLKDNFTLDFMPIQPNKKPEYDGELSSIADRVYLPVCQAFLGNNGEGKTSVLQVLYYCYSLLAQGRIAYHSMDFSKEAIHLKVYFSYEENLYLYETRVLPPNQTSFTHEVYCRLTNQKLFTRKLPHYHFKTFWSGRYVPLFHKLSCSLEDTALTDYLHMKTPSIFFIKAENDTKMIYSALQLLSQLDEDEREDVMKIFHLPFSKFDLSLGENHLRLFVNKEWINMSASTLAEIISKGTIRGLCLYESICLALKEGSIVIVDELENSIPHELVLELMNLFLDSELNRHGASLYFSTYNMEILDVFHRYDNIHVVKRNIEGFINAMNLYTSFHTTMRVMKSKMIRNSSQFLKPEWNLIHHLRKILLRKIRS